MSDCVAAYHGSKKLTSELNRRSVTNKKTPDQTRSQRSQN